MKGDKIVLQHRNRGLSDELTAINRYFLHSRTYQKGGPGKPQTGLIYKVGLQNCLQPEI